ncbi:MAG: right-handed parallel beta-helix repeat-containing protein [Kiritimatiellae bacterium]|nr:right-handed parallel beta-helix repeat-containing protein [Kiritimatiellia bacterium]
MVASVMPSLAQDAASPVQLVLEEPTFHCLGVRWFIGGDTNANARVDVQVRKAGDTNWLDAMPLFRVESEALEDRAPPAGQTIHAGSLLYLEPGTSYEVKLTLVDPDGGGTEQTFVQATRAEPEPPAPLRTLHVAPGSGGGSGSESDPFLGFAAAAAAAQSGDLFRVHAGTYTGPVHLQTSGTSNAPIVWRGAGDGEAVVEDPAGEYGIIAFGLSHIYIERLTVRNVRYGIRVIAGKDVVIRRCSLENANTGVFGDSGAQERILVSDNELDGGVPWPDSAGGEYRGIELAGVGHIICYNRIRNYKDGVCTRAPWPIRAIDIHNNDISECRDDGIELDFSEHNVRAYRNRITNVSLGISFQPSRGGPNYALHNALYNVDHETFKLHLTPTNEGEPDWRLGPHRTSGGVLLHNTVVKSNVAFRVWSSEGPAHYFTARNNLLIGLPAYYAVEITCPMRWADFDHNGWMTTTKFAYWNETAHNTIAAFRDATGLEPNGLVITQEVAGVFAKPVAVPTCSTNRYPVAANDLRLSAGSPAVDRGCVLPGINTDFNGAAPDLGAHEFGRLLPQYGPRPETLPDAPGGLKVRPE